MGKAGKWFRSLLSSKKSPPESDTAAQTKERKKGKRDLSESGDKFKNVENPLASPYHEGLDANKHAIAVAAATAAVAEAALAAAQAAAEVVKLTSGGGSSRSGTAYSSGDRRRVVAAVKIQSGFRAYLARRALRALKGLVKLQAHVRGHLVRKQSADMLRRMQAMARIQARASANRAYPMESYNTKFQLSNSHHQGIVNLRKYGERSNIAKHGESTLKQYNSRSYGTNSTNKQNSHIASNWLDHWMERNAWNNRDDERNDKILEIDTWKPHHNTRRNDKSTLLSSQHVPSWNDSGLEYHEINSFSRLQEKLQKPNPSMSSEEVSSVISEKFPLSASSRPTSNMRGSFTPTRSECSRSLFGDYVGHHPSYMANTKSSRAKVRSQSAPKQRMQLEELNLSWKFGRGLLESDAASGKGSTQPLNYKNNAYLSNLRRQGSSTHDVGYGYGYGYSSAYGHRP